MGNNNTVQTSGARGTKLVKQTGLDNSSYGDKSTKGIKNDMKGGTTDISSSIKDGKVRSY